MTIDVFSTILSKKEKIILMYAKLPSTKALVAFEAVARHLSLTKAAQEISVTSSALSKQIQALEAQLGTRLLLRSTRYVELTAEGKEFATKVANLLQQLKNSIANIEAKQSNRICLAAPHGFISYALMPTISSFRSAYPDISFSFSSHSENVIPDFEHGGINAAVVFLTNKVKMKGMRAMPIFEGCYLQPMCSPGLLQGKTPRNDAERLSKLPWLKNRKAPGFWDYWLCSAGMPDLKPSEICWFDDGAAVFEAAAAGMGVAMIGGADSGPSFANRLVPAHPFRMYSKTANHYLISPRNQKNESLRKFENWLINQFSLKNIST